MCRVEVDFEPPVAQMKGAMDEVAEGVLERQGHVDGDQDGGDHDPVDQLAHAPELGQLPVHDYDVSANVDLERNYALTK